MSIALGLRATAETDDDGRVTLGGDVWCGLCHSGGIGSSRLGARKSCTSSTIRRFKYGLSIVTTPEPSLLFRMLPDRKSGSFTGVATTLRGANSNSILRPSVMMY